MKIPAVPRRAFLLGIALSVVVPLLARLPGVPSEGWDWFVRYVPAAVVSALPGLLLAMTIAGIASSTRRRPLPFWCSVAATVAFLLWWHGRVPIPRGDSPGIGFVIVLAAMLGSAAALLGALGGHLLGRVLERSPSG
jgi:hypothetical protein